MTSSNIVPIFTVSCVTGEGLDLFYKFLHVLPPEINVKDRERLVQSNTEFQVMFEKNIFFKSNDLIE